MMKPAGWFQIGWSTDFPPGHIAAEAVLRRGDGGVPRRRRDAPCSRRVLRPHGRPSRLWRRGLRRPGGLPVPRLGVERRRSRTSASRTRIDPTGRCAIRSWPVMEQNDIVYLWHHRDGSGPVVDAARCLRSARRRRRGLRLPRCASRTDRSDSAPLALDPFVVLDNAADPSHFKTVHETKAIPVVVSSEPEGHLFRVKLGFGVEVGDGPGPRDRRRARHPRGRRRAVVHRPRQPDDSRTS